MKGWRALRQRLLLLQLLLLALSNSARAATAPSCPGVSRGHFCDSPTCQLHICSALKGLATALSGGDESSIVWFDTSGWWDPWLTFNASCAAAAARAAPGAPPPYCSGWVGVQCCRRAASPDDAGDDVWPACDVVGAPRGILLAANGLNGSLSDARLLPALKQLDGCGLQVLDLEANELAGTLSPGWGDLVNLQELSVMNNWLEGTLPPEMSKMRSLRALRLGANNLEGPIPNAWGRLPNLTALHLGSNQGGPYRLGLSGTLPHSLMTMQTLQELNLEQNQLSGELPEEMCGGKAPQLRNLELSGNNISGQVHGVPKCSALETLDLSGNLLTGSVPTSSLWHHLISYVVSANQFTGSIPNAMYQHPRLLQLDLSSNQLTGTISPTVTLMQYLKYLRLSNNLLTGDMPPYMFYIASLRSLDVSNNRLQGTIPSYAVPWLIALQSMKLDGNQDLTGPLPDQMGMLRQLELVDVRGTNMRGVDGGELPCFLRARRSIDVPYDATSRDADANTYVTLMCPLLERAPPGTVCDDSNQTITLAAPDARVADSKLQVILDPYYFAYRDCQCPEGSATMVIEGGEFVACRPKPVSAWRIIVPPIIGIVLSALCIALLVMCVANYVRSKPAAIRRLQLARKRLRGVPRDGQVSIVVTDIEGYSDLMKTSPKFMTKALSVHNAVMRRVAWDNAGYVVEQEGDSFVLVFSDALDACAFTLQMQQALQSTDWPLGISAAASGSGDSAASTSLSHSVDLADISAALMSPTAAAAAAPLTKSSVGPNARKSSWFSSVWRSNALGDGPASGASGTLQSARSRFLQMITGVGSASGRAGAINGLRVRMGVVTGFITPERELKNTVVWDLAKVVGDIGNGGQVLLCSTTFSAIKDRLHELGCVTDQGLKLVAAHGDASLWRRLLRCFRPVQSVGSGQEALVLDMGAWEVPGLAVKAATSAAPGTAPQLGSPAGGAGGGTFGKAGGSAAAAAAAAGPRPALTSSAIVGAMPSDNALRLYALYPPALVWRAEAFGNKMALKQGSACVDLPYWNAPSAPEAGLAGGSGGAGGLRSAPSGLSVDGPSGGGARGGAADASVAAADLLPPLPSVAMVFASVEGGKALARKRRAEALLVHQATSALMRATLRYVDGGYFVREQEGDLKYMVAFDSAREALRWCVLMQGAMLYQPWPEAVAACFQEARAPGSGELLFRGPRLKMGVCAGEPRTILPDHLGRADYHGSSVNQAARYMDAAAHGGMVVCEEALVRELVETEQGAAAEAVAAAAAAAAAAADAAAADQAGAADAAEQQQQQLDGSSLNGDARSGGSIIAPLGGAGAASRSASLGGPSPLEAAQQRVRIDAATAQLSALYCLHGRVTDPTPVDVHHIGSFQFKGNPAPIEMVHVQLSTLYGRTYPVDPPKGKGSRLAERTGVVVSGLLLPMPAVLTRMRDEWAAADAAAQHARETASNNSSVGSGMEHLRNSLGRALTRTMTLGHTLTRATTGSTTRSGGGASAKHMWWQAARDLEMQQHQQQQQQQHQWQASRGHTGGGDDAHALPTSPFANV